mgnify:CR=1 FL=1
MSLLKRGGEGGTDDLGRSRLVAITNGEARVQQALIDQLAVTAGDGLIHPGAVGDRPLTGAGNATRIVEADHDGDRQITGDVQTTEDLDSHVQIGGSLLDGVEMGEVGEVAQVHLLEIPTPMKRSA